MNRTHARLLIAVIVLLLIASACAGWSAAMIGTQPFQPTPTFQPVMLQPVLCWPATDLRTGQADAATGLLLCIPVQ